MPDRKPERRVLAVAAVLTGLGMGVLPTTGMAILMPWVMQQGAYSVPTAAVIQTAHTYGLILGALPMAALIAGCEIGALLIFQGLARQRVRATADTGVNTAAD